MGSISIKKNEINNSIKFYQKALSINSNFIGSILNLGVAFQKLGKDEKLSQIEKVEEEKV